MESIHTIILSTSKNMFTDLYYKPQRGFHSLYKGFKLFSSLIIFVSVNNKYKDAMCLCFQKCVSVHSVGSRKMVLSQKEKEVAKLGLPVFTVSVFFLVHPIRIALEK